MSKELPNTGSIALIGLGGAAIKITKDMHSIKNESTLVPKFIYQYLDTSDTEARLLPDKDMLTVIDTGTDLTGSGGIRAANYNKISEQVPGILNDLEESKITFVVFHSGGGSGATLSFVVLKELIEQDRSVVCFIVNTSNTSHRCANAVKTLKSIDTLAQKNNCVIPAFVYESTDFPDYNETNRKLVQDLHVLAAMLSPSLVSVDDSDRKNILNPMNMPDNNIYPGIHALDISVDEAYTGDNADIVSVFTLVYSGCDDDIGTGAEFIFSGELSPEFSPHFFAGKDITSVSLITKANSITDLQTAINAKLDEVQKTKKSKSRENKLALPVSIEVEQDEDGFVV